MTKPLSFKQRIAGMSPEELQAARQATALEDRTHFAEYIAGFDDDRGETLEIFEQEHDTLAAVSEEVFVQHESEKLAPTGSAAKVVHVKFMNNEQTPETKTIDLSIALNRSLGAGPDSVFPTELLLAPSWFEGRSVTIRFIGQGSTSYVLCRGLEQDLILTLLNGDDQPLGRPLRVGPRPARLPAVDWSQLSRIEVSVADKLDNAQFRLPLAAADSTIEKKPEALQTPPPARSSWPRLIELGGVAIVLDREPKEGITHLIATADFLDRSASAVEIIWPHDKRVTLTPEHRSADLGNLNSFLSVEHDKNSPLLPLLKYEVK